MEQSRSNWGAMEVDELLTAGNNIIFEKVVMNIYFHLSQKKMNIVILIAPWDSLDPINHEYRIYVDNNGGWHRLYNECTFPEASHRQLISSLFRCCPDNWQKTFKASNHDLSHPV